MLYFFKINVIYVRVIFVYDGKIINFEWYMEYY